MRIYLTELEAYAMMDGFGITKDESLDKNEKLSVLKFSLNKHGCGVKDIYRTRFKTNVPRPICIDFGLVKGRACINFFECVHITGLGKYIEANKKGR